MRESVRLGGGSPDSASSNARRELVDVPDEHLGQTVTDKSAHAICRLYLDYLGGLLTDAEKRFG